MSKLLWLDEAILEVIKRNGGVVSVDKLMEELWKMEWKEGKTACSGWVADEEDGRISHWCRQAWEVLKLMEYKGVVKVLDGVVRLNNVGRRSTRVK